MHLFRNSLKLHTIEKLLVMHLQMDYSGYCFKKQTCIKNIHVMKPLHMHSVVESCLSDDLAVPLLGW